MGNSVIDDEEVLKEQFTDWEKNFWVGENPRLYKYRGNLYRDLLTLQNNLLYIPSREELNDPNESSLNLADVYKAIDLVEKIYLPKDGTSLRKEMEEFIGGIGIFSMCKIPNAECLWSYYSNGHRGFCIEYDAIILREVFRDLGILSHVLELEYNFERTVPTIYNIGEELSKNVQFLRKTTASKSRNWAGEQEVRFILRDKSKYIDISDKAVTGIYMGARCSDFDKKLIVKAIKSMGNCDIKLYQMKFKDDSFDMDSEEINLK